MQLNTVSNLILASVRGLRPKRAMEMDYSGPPVDASSKPAEFKLKLQNEVIVTSQPRALCVFNNQIHVCCGRDGVQTYSMALKRQAITPADVTGEVNQLAVLNEDTVIAAASSGLFQMNARRE